MLSPPERPITDRQMRPVLGWAALGAVFVLLFAYLIFMWFWSGDAKPTPTGDVPTYTLVATRAVEVFQAIFVPIFLYHVVVKPWRKTGVLTNDGVFCLAGGTVWWQDTFCNSLADFTNNSAVFLNLGSWDRHIPFWSSPNGNKVVEPFLGASGIMYLWAPLCLAMLGNLGMRMAKKRWPGLGVFGQLCASVAMLAGVTMIMELGAVRLGLWSYQGAHSWASLFHGTYYQFPLYEPILLGIACTAWGALRYFRDDKGQMFAERGLERVHTTPGKKNLLRVLAVGAVMNLAFLFLWGIPVAHIATTQDAWPPDMVKRTYLTNDICGPGTGYACPSREIPMAHKNSIHVGPDGEFIVPDGVRLPRGGTTHE